jgi:hypothetical protein
MLFIEDYEIFKLQVPLGRVIGDNNCHYDEMEVICINLKTNHGHLGWGYAESVWNGVFTRDAWYIKQLPSINQLEKIFEETWWPKLKNVDPNNLESLRKLKDDSGLFEVVNMLNHYSDPYYNDDEKRQIKYIYILMNYFKANTFIPR